MFKPSKPQHIVNKKFFDSKFPEQPTQDGTYMLRCIVSDGVATYSWSREAAAGELPTFPNTSPSEVPTETP